VGREKGGSLPSVKCSAKKKTKKGEKRGKREHTLSASCVFITPLLVSVNQRQADVNASIGLARVVGDASLLPPRARKAVVVRGDMKSVREGRWCPSKERANDSGVVNLLLTVIDYPAATGSVYLITLRKTSNRDIRGGLREDTRREKENRNEGRIQSRKRSQTV